MANRSQSTKDVSTNDKSTMESYAHAFDLISQHRMAVGWNGYLYYLVDGDPNKALRATSIQHEEVNALFQKRCAARKSEVNLHIDGDRTIRADMVGLTRAGKAVHHKLSS